MWNDPDITYRLMIARIDDRLAAADRHRLLRRRKATAASVVITQPAEEVPCQAA